MAKIGVDELPNLAACHYQPSQIRFAPKFGFT